MPHDPRVYAVITHDFADSPKMQVVSVEARWALLEMILYSCRMQTDGVLSKRLAAAKWPLDVCLELASNDGEKPSLVETENEWIIHDFLEHQTSKAEIEARRKQKQEAGRRECLMVCVWVPNPHKEMDQNDYCGETRSG